MSHTVPGQRPAAPEPLHLVQAFVNTRWQRTGVDDLDSPAALRHWLVARGLAEDAIRVGPADLALALDLRATLRGAIGDGHRVPQARVLQSLPLGCDIRQGRLVLAPKGSGVTAALARILVAALEGDRDGRWERLKLCAASDCRWAFYDPSRNRSATWCNMAVCGSRAKARSYYRRHRGPAEAAADQSSSSKSPAAPDSSARSARS